MHGAESHSSISISQNSPAKINVQIYDYVGNNMICNQFVILSNVNCKVEMDCKLHYKLVIPEEIYNGL